MKLILQKKNLAGSSFSGRAVLRCVRAFCLFAALFAVFLQGNARGAGTGDDSKPAKVVIFYIDGLRPDTIDEMVVEGKLPNIQKLFYDQGVRFKNFFCLFPSNTVVSNGVLLTGQWPENTGLKTQALFERYGARKRSRFERFWKHERFPRYFNLLTETDVAARILKENKIRAIHNYLGGQYHPAIVPVSASVAPTAWPHVAANDVDRPYFVTVEAANKIDELNGNYAARYMATDPRSRVFLTWFPGMDEEQHRDEWGQHGQVTREKIIIEDKWIGKIYKNMLNENKGYKIYAMLLSDHGAVGGENGIYNQPFHIARDFFYKKLKINVRGADFSITHPGTDSGAFAFIDNMGRGQLKVFLPVKDISSGDWSRPNTLYELEHYGLGPNREPVNLTRALAEIQLGERNVFPRKTDPHPVEFVILKISNDLIYLRKTNGTQAVILIKEDGAKHLYRYVPVSKFEQDQSGKVSYEETFSGDPFDYTGSLMGSPDEIKKFLQEYHDDKEWLTATYKTHYPDGVIALAKPFQWKPELAAYAQSQDPDISLSAMPGWSFRIENVNGADHGYLSEGALRSTLMMTGPGIKHGAIEAPHRMIEVLPTVFEMIDYQGKTDFDVKPIRDIYEN